jgi:hypothetical protein
MHHARCDPRVDASKQFWRFCWLVFHLHENSNSGTINSRRSFRPCQRIKSRQNRKDVRIPPATVQWLKAINIAANTATMPARLWNCPATAAILVALRNSHTGPNGITKTTRTQSRGTYYERGLVRILRRFCAFEHSYFGRTRQHVFAALPDAAPRISAGRRCSPIRS